MEGRAAGESRELDFMPWGGAYNRRRPEETAFVHRDERFPAQARRDGARRRPLPEQGRGPPGGHPVVGVGPRLGLWPGVPELRRSLPGALGRRLLRLQLLPVGSRQGDHDASDLFRFQQSLPPTA